MAGENLPLVGKLLGHRRHRTTAGYAHLADGHLVEAAEKVEGFITAAMRFSVDPPKVSSSVRSCAGDPVDDRHHHKLACRVTAWKRT